MEEKRVYAAIDLKSFYASVECVARGLDPLTARLVVADPSRTEKTICLAVSPALKQYGLSGRSRLFEVVEKAREVKARTGEELTYIVAPPRMKTYMDVSARIYEKVYLRWCAPEDVHVYSIDEVFIDLTQYLPLYGMPAHALVRQMIRDVLRETGITATAGIGTNLYLAKIAMDIVAKHVEADEDGVRIAELDERAYRERLWDHRPLTDFWRVGRGIAARLEKRGMRTMGDVARRSLDREDELFREFGVDAELLIDHAWGVETCRMEDIKAFEPETRSISSGQVLAEPYDFRGGRLIVAEMADQLALDLAAKGLTADSVSLVVCYDNESVRNGSWQGAVEADRYGRIAPKPAHGKEVLRDAGGAPKRTDSARKLIAAALAVYDRVTEPDLPVRRFYLVFNGTEPKRAEAAEERQLDMFTDMEALEKERGDLEREARLQRALLGIKGKYGRNAVLKGMNLEEGATAAERNRLIGGHAAGEEL